MTVSETNSIFFLLNPLDHSAKQFVLVKCENELVMSLVTSFLKSLGSLRFSSTFPRVCSHIKFYFRDILIITVYSSVLLRTRHQPMR